MTRVLRARRIGVPLIGADGAAVPPAWRSPGGGSSNNVQGFPVYGAQPVSQRMVDALVGGQLDIAVGWGPTVGYYARRPRFRSTSLPVPDDSVGARMFSTRDRRAGRRERRSATS